ncbi:FdtA/QdtA family cupin domain-containing protein [Flavobacterium sp.]|uniref:sugar 3,4-ketoisomerase n=1 Tax=Flavobacterium sp. TaxID=239 RepID=UPI00286B9EE4|nr:FdtA/QdtA family cupin domain-containing protein [Flavobacterium sp.]
MSKLSHIKLIELPVIEDARGNLAFIQEGFLSFNFKRVYYLYDVPSSAHRGGHSHIDQNEVLIALSGSFEVIVDDGLDKKSYFLNKPNTGLHITPGIWRELGNFSSGAICMVLNSDIFKEEDYIRDYVDFLQSKE